MVPEERFELPTFGLQNRCTTTVLFRHSKNRRKDTIILYLFQHIFIPFLLLFANMNLKSVLFGDRIKCYVLSAHKEISI